ncbi:MAG: hypothetical protein V4708_04040 [Bacteroidota bacterium]
MKIEYGATGKHLTAKMVRSSFVAEDNIMKDIESVDSARMMA